MSPAELHKLRAWAGANVITLKGCDAVVYVNRGGVRPVARAFLGKSLKRAWGYSFKDIAAMHKYIAQWHTAQREACEAKAKREADKKAFRHTLKAGDVLYASWGYDQTNIDYYQVTELHGEHVVSARPIARASEGTGWEQGRSVPDVGNFTGEAKRYKPTNGNKLRVYSFCCAYPLESRVVAGARVYESHAWTSYA